MLYSRVAQRRSNSHISSLYLSAFWSTTRPSQLSVKNQFSMLNLWRYYHHKCGQLYRPALLEQLMVSQPTNPLQSVEAEVSFPYSKFISTCLYSEPDYSRQTLQFSVCRFHFNNNLLLSKHRSSKWFFPSVPTTKHLYIFLFFYVSVVESVSSSFDFIALIIFGELFILRSFSLDNRKEKSLIGRKWRKFALLLCGTYSYTTVA